MDIDEITFGITKRVFTRLEGQGLYKMQYISETVKYTETELLELVLQDYVKQNSLSPWETIQVELEGCKLG